MAITDLPADEVKLLPTEPVWRRKDDLRKLPLAISKLTESGTSKVSTLIHLSFVNEASQFLGARLSRRSSTHGCLR